MLCLLWSFVSWVLRIIFCLFSVVGLYLLFTSMPLMVLFLVVIKSGLSVNLEMSNSWNSFRIVCFKR